MEFPSNSRKATENEPTSKQAGIKLPVQKVVTGEVVKRKKPLGRRFKEIFLGAEFKGAAQYITGDVLLPAVRNMVVDATTKGIERFVYGDTSPSRRRSMDPRAGRVSYNSPVNRMGRQESTMMPRQPPHQVPHSQRDPGEIILVSRQEAESVLEALIDILDKYEVVSVADLYSLVGLPTNMIDNKWGWSALHYVNIRQVREGWLLDLPSVEPI